VPVQDKRHVGLETLGPAHVPKVLPPEPAAPILIVVLVGPTKTKIVVVRRTHTLLFISPHYYPPQIMAHVHHPAHLAPVRRSFVPIRTAIRTKKRLHHCSVM
jgi:hypothetical protein